MTYGLLSYQVMPEIRVNGIALATEWLSGSQWDACADPVTTSWADCGSGPTTDWEECGDAPTTTWVECS